MNEVKPFTAKIREYRDGKRAPIEVVGPTMVSDFDKPPYIDRGLGVVRVLDDFSENDANIMFFDNAYKNYFSITNKGDNVFRHNNTTLVFDRTNYELTQFGHNRSNTTVNVSIARNIANINQMNEANITASSQMRAIDRIFKFDPIVRASFVAEVNSHFNNSSAGTNTTQIATTEFVTGAVASATITDATTIAKGKLQLAGDLAGTADAPTVPGLALKAPIASPTFTGTVTAPIYASTPQALTDAATIDWNPTNGLNASVTLGGNRTLSFSSMPAIGSYGTLVVTQDATGGRTITLPSTSNKVLGSTSTTTVPGAII
jgi:hypothetical protein